jgi:predicted transcriptional regulator
MGPHESLSEDLSNNYQCYRVSIASKMFIIYFLIVVTEVDLLNCFEISLVISTSWFQHQSNEELLRENFEKVKRERDDIGIKTASLEAQVNDLKEEIKRFQDETNHDQEKKEELEHLNDDFQAQVKSQTQKIGELCLKVLNDHDVYSMFALAFPKPD